MISWVSRSTPDTGYTKFPTSTLRIFVRAKNLSPSMRATFLNASLFALRSLMQPVFLYWGVSLSYLEDIHN